MRTFAVVAAVVTSFVVVTTLFAASSPSLAATSKSAGPVSLAPAAGARLISESQFTNTIVAMFGPDFSMPAAFAPVRREKGLVAVGSSSAFMTPGAFDGLDDMAAKIAAKAMEPTYRDLFLACRPAVATKPDPACAKQFIARTGRLLFRRALTQSEIESHAAIANKNAAMLNDFYAGIKDAMLSLMVAPDFLFIRENFVPRTDGTTTLTAYSKATRLSILLWDAYPDDELLAAAEDGSLDTERGLTRQVDRMLASPRVGSSVRALFSDMLQFDQFASLSKDPEIYPAFNGKVAADAREQTLKLLVDHLITNNLDYRDIFTTRKTYLTDDLGMIYGVPVSKPSGWVEYTFPEDSPRVGLMTNIGMLALYSHPGRSSPTRRGRALRELLLCQPVPDPPANVDFSGFQDPKSPAKTARERLIVHSTNPVCAGCHKITDPIGLGLENFDGAGQFRAEERGTDIDASGTLNGVNFTGGKELGRVLHDSPAVISCLVNRTSAYSLGRAMTDADSEWLKYLEGGFAQSGYRFRSLLRMIALNEAFYKVPAAVLAPQ